MVASSPFRGKSVPFPCCTTFLVTPMMTGFLTQVVLAVGCDGSEGNSGRVERIESNNAGTRCAWFSELARKKGQVKLETGPQRAKEGKASENVGSVYFHSPNVC